MNETGQQRGLWYTRRGSVVRGPYRQQQLSGYVLLGRIRDDDDVRPEGGDWVRLDQRPDLIPDVLTLPPGKENRQKLLIARQRADERGRRDRRKDQKGAGVPSRRGGVFPGWRSGLERRRSRAGSAWVYPQVNQPVSPGGLLRRYRLFTAALLVVCGFFLSYLQGAPPIRESLPECTAPARPGVNWAGCNLSGLAARHANLAGAQLRNARLDAVDLSFGNLHHADLSNASLIGISVRGADLRDARLRGADLAYANLSDSRLEGADLSGADLSHAIWVDRKPCLAESIGACRRLP